MIYCFDNQRYLSRRDEFIGFYTNEFPQKNRESLDVFLNTIDRVYKKLQQNDYIDASNYLKNVIIKQGCAINDIADAELLIGLIRMDAVIDAFYYKRYRSCVNKNYIICCFYSMIYDDLYKKEDVPNYLTVPYTASLLNALFSSDRQSMYYIDNIYEFIQLEKKPINEPEMPHPIFYAFQTQKNEPVLYTKEQFLDSVISCLYYCSDFQDTITLYISNDDNYNDTYNYIKTVMKRDYPKEKSKYMGLYVFCLFKTEKAKEFYERYYNGGLPFFLK